jgi:hypothetical protein
MEKFTRNAYASHFIVLPAAGREQVQVEYRLVVAVSPTGVFDR